MEHREMWAGIILFGLAMAVSTTAGYQGAKALYEDPTFTTHRTGQDMSTGYFYISSDEREQIEQSVLTEMRQNHCVVTWVDGEMFVVRSCVRQ